jgi:PAS domain S-box-containing protein
MKKAAKINDFGAPVVPENLAPSPDLSLFASIINASTDAIISKTPKGIIISWNPGAENLYGYSAAEIIGKNISLIIPGEYITEEKDISAKILSGETLTGHETKRKTKSGSVPHVVLSVSPVKNHLGVITAIAEISRDISREKQSDDALKQTAAQLNAIVENTEEGFVLTDTNCIIKAFNVKARESLVFTGTSARIKAGDHMFDYIDEERKETFRQVVATVLEGKGVRYDRKIERNGKVTWYHFSLSPVKEDTIVTGICMTGMDITKRKLAEEKVEQNERRFRGLVENSGDGVTIFCPDGHPLYVSSAITKLLGYTEEEAMQLDLFSLVHPDEIEAVKKIWGKIIASPGIPYTGNICRILHKNGSWRWFEGTITNMLHDPSIGGIVDNFRDITGKIEADQQLRLSEERYRYLFYHNPLPMWIYDPETLCFLEVNDAAVAKYMYSREEFLKLTLGDIRPFDDVDKLIASVTHRQAKMEYSPKAWSHLKKNGDLLYVEISSHMIRFENKDAILVLANDVTEKKKAAQLLMRAYQENTTILESITDGFFTVDKNWTVTYFNKEAEKILGMKRENILGRNIWQVYPSAKCLKFYTESQRSLDEQVAVNFQEFFAELNLWLDVSSYPSDKGLSIYFKDITEKKVAEEKIRVANERYEMVAGTTNDVIYEWDIINDTNYWSEGYETLFGHKRTGDKMPVTSWIDNLHPDEKDKLFAETYYAFENKLTSLTRELRFKCADGSYKIIFDKLAILYDKGMPVKLVGAMQDITERKETELAVKELNEQLNKRAEELVSSNQELERFAYVASHDLQEPLRMVSSFLQLLQKKYSDQLDQTANQYIDFAVDGSERMKRLILDLLEYSRVGTNKDVFTDTDMGEVIETVLKNYDSKITEKDAVIKVSLMPVIKANKTQITQLIQNLIGNALKYNTSFVPEIEIGCEDKENAWQFFIRDNGIGIDPKFFDKIFVIFQRLHNKTQFSGTGIGLAICKKIVDRHNGNIWLTSELGSGSCFYFTIKKTL